MCESGMYHAGLAKRRRIYDVDHSFNTVYGFHRRKDASIMNRKTLENIFQGIIDKYEEMEPTNLGGLEDETLDDMHKFGKALMQWKLDEWNTLLC